MNPLESHPVVVGQDGDSAHNKADEEEQARLAIEVAAPSGRSIVSGMSHGIKDARDKADVKAGTP